MDRNENLKMVDNSNAEEVRPQETQGVGVSTPKQKFDFSRLNTLAVVSLAAGISGIGALIAVITGHVSLAQIRRTSESGKALAIVGTVLGYIHLAGWIIFTIIAIVTTALFWGMEPGDYGFMEFRRGFDGMHMGGDR